LVGCNHIIIIDLGYMMTQLKPGRMETHRKLSLCKILPSLNSLNTGLITMVSFLFLTRWTISYLVDMLSYILACK